MRDEEARDIEKKAMLEQLRKNEEIEIEKMKEKAEMVRKAQAEVKIANNRALEMRKKQADLERAIIQRVLVRGSVAAVQEPPAQVVSAGLAARSLTSLAQSYGSFVVVPSPS